MRRCAVSSQRVPPKALNRHRPVPCPRYSLRGNGPLIVSTFVNLRLAAALFLVLLAACAHVAPLTPAPAPDRPMTAADFSADQLGRAIFDETNRVRVAHGVPPLGHAAPLDAAAEEQASYMSLDERAGHSNPFPGEANVAERVGHEGLDNVRVAENVIMVPSRRPQGEEPRYYTYSQFAALLLNGWMNSPPHRANIMNPKFTYLGCSARLADAILAGDQRVYAAQVFLLPLVRQGPGAVSP